MIGSTSPDGGRLFIPGHQFTLTFLPISRYQRCMFSNKLNTLHGATETRGIIVLACFIFSTDPKYDSVQPMIGMKDENNGRTHNYKTRSGNIKLNT